MSHRRTNEGHPASSDRYYSTDEAEFLAAMERFRRETGRQFPTWSEALGVLRALGYRRTDAA